MNGIGLIILLVALIVIFGGLYLVAWWFCAVQRSSKQGHYILEAEEGQDTAYHTSGKLYGGLDMVDEASYVKNPLDLDTINESSSSSAGVVESEKAKEAAAEQQPSAPQDD